MDDTSSGAGAMASNAMGRASGVYNEAVTQAGPGMAANASVLLTVVIAVTSLINFIDNPRSSSFGDVPFAERWVFSFSPASLGLIGLLLVGAVLTCRGVSGEVKPLTKKQLLSIGGLTGLIVSVVMIISTALILTLDSGTGVSRMNEFLRGIGFTALVLASSLWCTSESRKA